MTTSRTYVLDDGTEVDDLDGFIADNEDFDEEIIQALRALKPGESFTDGGGAWAEWTLTRVS